MDNPARYGFRLVKSRNGAPAPIAHPGWVVSGQSFDVNGGASNVYLRPGDPLIALASGALTLCDGAEGATGALTPIGVVASILQYWDGSRIVKRKELPSDMTYTTDERRTLITWYPFRDNLFEIDVDDIVTATTRAGYLALMHSNINYRLHGASGERYAKPKADISTTNTTNTLVLRIQDIPRTAENMDYAGANVKIIVKANLYQEPEVSATGL